MGKSPADLTKFLRPFPEEVQEITVGLREFVRGLYPDSNELIYDNYNAFVIGYSISDTAGDAFCALAVYSKYVNFGFNRGSEIADPEKKLKGSGNQYRHYTVKELKDFPKAYIKKLLREAYQNAIARARKNKKIMKGESIIKSVSPVKRRPA